MTSSGCAKSKISASFRARSDGPFSPDPETWSANGLSISKLGRAAIWALASNILLKTGASLPSARGPPTGLVVCAVLVSSLSSSSSSCIFSARVFS